MISTRIGSQKQESLGVVVATTSMTRLAVLIAQNATGLTRTATQVLGGDRLQCAAANRRKLSSGETSAAQTVQDFVELSALPVMKQLYWTIHHRRANADAAHGSSDQQN